MFKRFVEMLRGAMIRHMLSTNMPNNVLIRQIMFHECDDCRDCMFEDWCLAETIKHVK